MTGPATLTWGAEESRGARWPTPARPGQTIGLCAPAHVFDRREMERGAEVLRSWGYEVKIPPAIFRRHRRLAGTDGERLETLDNLMQDPAVAAVMAVRGGFGCQRLLPRLADLWRNWPPKPLIGFSDLTALHLGRLKDCGVVGYHGPMAVSLGKTDPGFKADLPSRKDLKKILAEPDQKGGWTFPAQGVLKPGQAEGPLIGGNLTMFNALLSSPWKPELEGAIILLEEIGEPGHRLDRLLTTLRQSDMWRKSSALIFGSFKDCGPPPRVRELLKEAAVDFQGPVITNAPFGHGRRNRVFPIGAMAALKVDG